MIIFAKSGRKERNRECSLVQGKNNKGLKRAESSFKNHHPHIHPAPTSKTR
jgi:hypothetical protein